MSVLSRRQIQWALSAPHLPVQRAELDGFGNVVGGEAFGGGQVGDGPAPMAARDSMPLTPGLA